MKCERCAGQGTVPMQYLGPTGPSGLVDVLPSVLAQLVYDVPCPECNGTGQVSCCEGTPRQLDKKRGPT